MDELDIINVADEGEIMVTSNYEDEVNIVEDVVVDDDVYVSDTIAEDLPNIIEAGQFYIYVPIASTSNRGIAQFNNTHFVVEDGIVYIKISPKAEADQNGENIIDTYQRKDNMIEKWIGEALENKYPSAKLVKDSLDNIIYKKGKNVFVFKTQEDFINWIDGKIYGDLTGKSILDLNIGDDMFMLDGSINYWCKSLNDPLTLNDFMSYAKSIWGSITGDINLQEDLLELLDNKVDKIEGYSLSQNDFNNAYKSKLETLENYDDTSIKNNLETFKNNTNRTLENVNTQLSNLEENKASKDFVNSSIETATATFKGTFTNLDTLKATQADNNDYAFYDHYVADNRTFDKYKYDGSQWKYEYSLNNSSFTDAQWKAINSGITVELKNQILTNTDSINNLLNTVAELNTNKADKTEIPTNNNQLTNGAGYITASRPAGAGIEFKSKDATHFMLYGNPQVSELYAQIKQADGTNHYVKVMDLAGKLYSNSKEVAVKEDIPTDYLPLSGGSSKPLSGSLYANEGIYVGSDSSANNTKGVVFTNPNSQTTKLGFSNGGVFGIYASGYINLSTPGMLPVPTKTTSLGTSAYQYKNIYGETLYQNGKQVANKEDIPTSYIKDASVTDDVLTIEKQDGTKLQFEGGGGTEIIIRSYDEW